MQDTMVGKKFGNLVVQKLAYRGKDSKKYWECQCGCGRVCLVQESHLKNGHTKSCGCLRKKKDDEPLAGSYRAEVRETCGPAAGESG